MLKKPPISIDERTITHVANDPDDEIVRGLTRAATIARENAHRLHAAAEAVAIDQTRSDAAKRFAIRDASLQIGGRIAAELDKARAAAEAEIARVTAATAAPPPLRDPLAISIEAETRAALRRMTHEDRRRALADERVLGAALRGPGLLGGLSEIEQAAMGHNYRSKAHPAAAARLDRLGKAVAAFDRLGQNFASYIETGAALGGLEFEQAQHAEKTLAAATRAA